MNHFADYQYDAQGEGKTVPTTVLSPTTVATSAPLVYTQKYPEA
jgi:hypothetical protein